MHGVRGASGGVPARGPVFPPNLRPRAPPSPRLFSLRNHSRERERESAVKKHRQTEPQTASWLLRPPYPLRLEPAVMTRPLARVPGAGARRGDLAACGAQLSSGARRLKRHQRERNKVGARTRSRSSRVAALTTERASRAASGRGGELWGGGAPLRPRLHPFPHPENPPTPPPPGTGLPTVERRGSRSGNACEACRREADAGARPRSDRFPGPRSGRGLRCSAATTTSTPR